MGGELAFVLVLAAFTAGVLRWALNDLNALGKTSELARFAARLSVFAWLYAVVGSAMSATWRVGVPASAALALGAFVAVLGLGLLTAGIVEMQAAARKGATSRGGRVYARMRHPQAVGVVVLFAGIAVAGRSGLGLLLAALFAVFAWRYVGMTDRGEPHADQGEGDHRVRALAQSRADRE